MQPRGLAIGSASTTTPHLLKIIFSWTEGIDRREKRWIYVSHRDVWASLLKLQCKVCFACWQIRARQMQGSSSCQRAFVCPAHLRTWKQTSTCSHACSTSRLHWIIGAFCLFQWLKRGKKKNLEKRILKRVCQGGLSEVKKQNQKPSNKTPRKKACFNVIWKIKFDLRPFLFKLG